MTLCYNQEEYNVSEKTNIDFACLLKLRNYGLMPAMIHRDLPSQFWAANEAYTYPTWICCSYEDAFCWELFV